MRPSSPAVLTFAALAVSVVPAPELSATTPEPPIVADTLGWDAEVEAGRFWHAVAAFKRAGGGGAMAPGDQLALARAEAGWANWGGVVARLQAEPWLDRFESGEGRFLLARAYEELDRSQEAADAYESFLQAAGLGDDRALVARIRLTRLLAARSGIDERTLAVLDALPRSAADLRSWTALELAREQVDEADPVGVRALLERITDRPAVNQAWDLLARAFIRNGDSVGALAQYEQALADLDRTDARASTWSRIGDLRAALGDTAGARDAFLNTLELTAEGSAAVRAGSGLVELGVTTDAFALQVARTLYGANRYEDALDAYDHYAELVPSTGMGPRERFERGRVLSRLREDADAVESLLPLVDDPTIGGEATAELIRVRKRQRRNADVQSLQDRLVERYPSHPDAVEIVFLRADAAHDDGNLTEAIRLYRRTVEMDPGAERAELSRMRIGQIYVTRGDLASAAEVFEAHMAEVPDGRSVDEAAYWAARTRLQNGERDVAAMHVERVFDLDPISYYAVQTAKLLDMPYRIPVEERAPSMAPAWIASGLDRLDVLKASGLRATERAYVELLVERAGNTADYLLHLAKGFHQRDWNWRALDLGWRVRRAGRGWDRLLLEVLYPFPHEAIIRSEAEEWGVDPFLVAGLIRQESAFWAGARSSANARGLMQVLPETGGTLARRIGPTPFKSAVLYQPDVNLHLGTAYLRDMLKRYDNELPLVLSAYNAGPTRANRWRRRFPEVADPVRFTERIPFRETRGYVKNVTRNRAIYTFLYGERAE